MIKEEACQGRSWQIVYKFSGLGRDCCKRANFEGTEPVWLISFVNKWIEIAVWSLNYNSKNEI